MFTEKSIPTDIITYISSATVKQTAPIQVGVA